MEGTRTQSDSPPVRRNSKAKDDSFNFSEGVLIFFHFIHILIAFVTFVHTVDSGGNGLRRTVTWAEGTAAPKEVDIAISIPRYKRVKVSPMSLCIKFKKPSHAL